MYSDKENVNILTSLLVAHGVTDAVVCPGSRNAPIVHNLVECPNITCHSVTDERSAGFYALGIAQATLLPVAVCVTSGSALLNLLPAVAEAYYQHVPLVVISADRPQQWIDQLDGQTLPQPDALGRFVRHAVSLPLRPTPNPSTGRGVLPTPAPSTPAPSNPSTSSLHWYCNRMVNEALLACRQGGWGPVHINVPIDEPLYTFTTPHLPEERKVELTHSMPSSMWLEPCVEDWIGARRPLVIVGQCSEEKLMAEDFSTIIPHAVVLNEALSIGCGACHFDELLAMGEIPNNMKPDFVLYLGDVLVSKRMRQFLRSLPGVPMWIVSEDGMLHDVTTKVRGVIEGNPGDVLNVIGNELSQRANHKVNKFIDWWDERLGEIDEKIEAYRAPFSSMSAVSMLAEQLGELPFSYVHAGNSSAVRLANLYVPQYVYCNRGVNGIEGSLSTAAGFSLTVDEPVFCIVGDLSFFYDSNALWNAGLRSNLRILLLNNGGGGIFEKFEGLKQSAAREAFVMAKHSTSAQGLCQSFGIQYMKATNSIELEQGIGWLTTLHDNPEAENRPLLLEVVTTTENDAKALQGLHESLVKTITP